MNLISIIVPIFHGKRYMDHLIEQAEECSKRLDSRYRLELVFVNDDPSEILPRYDSSELIDIRTLETEVNRGIHGARVRGLEVCKGDYVLLLDQDDRIRPEYMKSQLEKLGRKDAVVCRAIHEGKCKYDATLPFERAVNKAYMIMEGDGIVSPGQVLLRKEAVSLTWKKHVFTHNGADDWLLWICMMSEGKTFVLNDEILYEHVVDGKNASWNSLEMTYSEHEMLEFLKKEKILKKEEEKALQKTIDRLASNRIRMMDKFKKMFFLYDAWLELYQEDLLISACLKKKGYKTAVIYGDGYFGKQLYRELEKNGITVACFLDRNADYLCEKIPVYRPEADWPEADILIVTLMQKEKGLMELLQRKTTAAIIYIEELLEEAKCQKYQ